MNIIKKQIPSGNYTVGRNGYKPELIVVHIMAGSIASCDSWFANPVSEVSAHYGISLTGEIHQYVDEKDIAYANGRVNAPTAKLLKAGINPNNYSISIEHEGLDLSKAPQVQIDASVALIKEIATRNKIPIDRDHVIGHYEIFSLKPNCPSTDKSIVNKLVSLASANTLDPLVTISVPKSKVDRVKAYIATL